MKTFTRLTVIILLVFTLAWLTLKIDAAIDHFKEDHTTHHFNSGLIEAMRQTILEKHPELLEMEGTPIEVIEE